MKRPRKLSTIELMMLGFAWEVGPCSTYTLMKMLSISGSSFYKSRAGTAYSVTKRLLENGFLTNTPNPKSDSEDHVKITDKGIRALQEWMEPPIPIQDVAHTADLLRLRTYFFSVIDKQARLDFVDDALKACKDRLKLVEKNTRLNAEDGHYFSVIAGLSSVLETKARIEWLERIRDLVENPPEDHSTWVETVLGKDFS